MPAPCDTNDQSCRADLRSQGYFVDSSGVYAPTGERTQPTFSGSQASQNTTPSGPYVAPASIGAAPPPGLTPAAAQAYLATLATVQASAAANLIPSGPGGAWVVPIAQLVSKGKSIEQALAEVMGAGAHTPTQGQGPAAGPTATAAALLPAATGRPGTGSNMWLWAGLGLGALLLMRRR